MIDEVQPQQICSQCVQANCALSMLLIMMLVLAPTFIAEYGQEANILT
jgi:hypothetical protein